MEISAIIPARMASSRFLGKSLVNILGKPMIQHVWERANESKYIDEVYIATPDIEIQKAAKLFGANVIMTNKKHRGCMDRVAEASNKINSDYIVLIQGDEPLINKKMIDLSIDFTVPCTNLIGFVNPSDINNKNVIKVLLNYNDNISLMTREPIFTPYKQVCIMFLPKVVLQRYSQLKPTISELSESIDMNRLLENGYEVKGIISKYKTHAIDIIDDVGIVENIMRK